MPRIVPEEIQINQRTPGVSLADGVPNVDSEIIAYSVPDKSQLEIRAADFIGMYLASSTPTELADDSLVTIMTTDPNNRRTEVLAQGEYAQFKELTDVQKKYFFKNAKVKVIPANFRLVIKVLAALAADDAQTRFTLSCKNVYETLS